MINELLRPKPQLVTRNLTLSYMINEIWGRPSNGWSLIIIRRMEYDMRFQLSNFLSKVNKCSNVSKEMNKEVLYLQYDKMI